MRLFEAILDANHGAGFSVSFEVIFDRKFL